MPYTIKPPSMLDQLQPGDSITADVVVEPDKYWLENVKVTGHSKAPAGTPTATEHIPNPGDLVPDFKLINQNGKRISLHQYRGQTLLLTLIYTRCPFPDFCPRVSHEFAAIECSRSAPRMPGGGVRQNAPAQHQLRPRPRHTPRFCARLRLLLRRKQRFRALYALGVLYDSASRVTSVGPLFFSDLQGRRRSDHAFPRHRSRLLPDGKIFSGIAARTGGPPTCCRTLPWPRTLLSLPQRSSLALTT